MARDKKFNGVLFSFRGVLVTVFPKRSRPNNPLGYPVVPHYFQTGIIFNLQYNFAFYSSAIKTLKFFFQTNLQKHIYAIILRGNLYLGLCSHFERNLLHNVHNLVLRNGLETWSGFQCSVLALFG